MPIDSVHPQYASRISQWQKCRDAYEGEDAIKKKGEIYLPKLEGQTPQEYARYKQRALFYSITSKSVGALVGMATTLAPKLEFPDAMRPHIDGAAPVNFSELYAILLTELILQSRVGVLVDFPEGGGDPYPAIYGAEDIINWDVNDDDVITRVVLRESILEQSSDKDPYEKEYSIRFRELTLENDSYIQRIYDKNRQLIKTIVPSVPPKAAGKIPFFAIHPLGLGFKDSKPLMLDIANINISHYMSSADLEHGRHFTGLPTPVVIGGDANSDIHIGSTKFLVIPEKGDAKYLEFTGQGLQSLEKAMTEKQSLLASMSARLLDNSSRGSEAEAAVKLRYTSETASLTTIVNAVEIALIAIYRTIAQFMLENPDSVKISLDTEFLESPLSAAEMTALFDGYFKKAISVETLIFNLRRGRRLSPDRTDADELSALISRMSESIQPQNPKVGV